MPLPRFSNLSQTEQNRLLDAATKEFAAHGYEDASVNRILAKAKTSKGALYYYFQDKDDLYATVVERSVLSLAPELTRGFAPATAAEFWPAIEALAVHGFELVRKYPEQMKALRSFQRDLRRHQKPAFANVLALVRANFAALVAIGRALGCVRDDLSDELLVELLEAVDAVIDARLFSEPDPGSPKVAKKYAALSVDLGRRLVDPAWKKERRR